ncbi:metal-dependent hydrolase [Hydrogenophaga sp. 5NK40-0174]|uniref:metal-dependent hydrolase n=1 Tax=Hydrogenophaga sp. 5NK40-0174 TaxID=3127649 RepID=UPI00310A8997
MDSLTQIALGSAVSVAVMGRRTAVWKAALWGAIGGTLPDLDAFIDHGSPLLNMVRHRAETHSLFYLTLFAPLLAALVAWWHGERVLFKRWWLALWLVLVTHPLLDNMTVYGTQLLQPFTAHPYGLDSMFIIDPLYTVPLLIGVVVAMRGRGDARGLRWNAGGLMISTSYLAWSLTAQAHVREVALASMQEQGIGADKVLVTPAPFNTVLWRVVAVSPTHYFEGYHSLIDKDRTMRWTSHERGAALIDRYASHTPASHLANFSKGFYKMSTSAETGNVLITDLRMGVEPSYTFTFDLGSPSQVLLSDAPRHVGQRGNVGLALQWVWKRALTETREPLSIVLERGAL